MNCDTDSPSPRRSNRKKIPNQKYQNELLTCITRKKRKRVDGTDQGQTENKVIKVSVSKNTDPVEQQDVSEPVVKQCKSQTDLIEQLKDAHKILDNVAEDPTAAEDNPTDTTEGETITVSALSDHLRNGRTSVLSDCTEDHKSVSEAAAVQKLSTARESSTLYSTENAKEVVDNVAEPAVFPTVSSNLKHLNSLTDKESNTENKNVEKADSKNTSSHFIDMGFRVTNKCPNKSVGSLDVTHVGKSQTDQKNSNSCEGRKSSIESSVQNKGSTVLKDLFSSNDDNRTEVTSLNSEIAAKKFVKVVQQGEGFGSEIQDLVGENQKYGKNDNLIHLSYVDTTGKVPDRLEAISSSNNHTSECETDLQKIVVNQSKTQLDLFTKNVIDSSDDILLSGDVTPVELVFSEGTEPSVLSVQGGKNNVVLLKTVELEDGSNVLQIGEPIHVDLADIVPDVKEEYAQAGEDRKLGPSPDQSEQVSCWDADEHRTAITQQHQWLLENTPDGQFKCKLCAYKTDKKANWYKHKKTHMDVSPYRCQHCSYKSINAGNLKRHMWTHSDIRKFQCEQCGTKFRQKIHLQRHVKYKHEAKQVKCTECDYVCANLNPDLKLHMERKHLLSDSGHPLHNFKCEECGFTTTSKKDLHQHIKFHKTGPELKLFCNDCSFVTDCPSRLNRHVLTHTKLRPFACEHCDYRASQKEHVLRHLEGKHNIKKTNADQVVSDNTESSREENKVAIQAIVDISAQVTGCNKDLSGKRTTQKYIQPDYRSKEKLFACNLCSMKFTKLINLFKHINVMHKEALPQQDGVHACVVCDFRTRVWKNMLVHMRKHTTEQTKHSPQPAYSCVICPFSHPKRQQLYTHMKKCHQLKMVRQDDGSYHTLVGSEPSSNDPTMKPAFVDVEEALSRYKADSQDEKVLKTVMFQTEPGTPYVPVAISATDSMTAENSNLEAIPVKNSTESVGFSDLPPTHQNRDSPANTIFTEVDSGSCDNTLEASISDIKLTNTELTSIQSGAFIEINGEMYKMLVPTEHQLPVTN